MKVIGLTGFAKSGKSTAAEILKSLGGQEVAFAKHLKDVCSVVFGVPRDHFDNQAWKEERLSFDRVICGNDIERILNYFEVPARFIPTAVMAHQGTVMTTPRHIAQYIGTEVLRSIDENIHINMAFKLAGSSSAKFLICSDVRFANELNAVQNAGGLVYGIYRKAVIPGNIENLHPSEREIPQLIQGANIVIANESTIEEFQRKVREEIQGFFNTRGMK